MILDCSEKISFLIWEFFSFSAFNSPLSCALPSLATPSWASRLELFAFCAFNSSSNSSRALCVISIVNCSSANFFSRGSTRSFRSSLSLVVMAWRDSHSLDLFWWPSILDRNPSTSLMFESWVDRSWVYWLLILSNSFSMSYIRVRQLVSSFSRSLILFVIFELWFSCVDTLLLAVRSSRWRSPLVSRRLSISAICSAIFCSDERSSFSRSTMRFVSLSTRIPLCHSSCLTWSSCPSKELFFSSKLRICLFFPSVSSRSLLASRLLYTISVWAFENASLFLLRSSFNFSRLCLSCSIFLWEFSSETSVFLTLRSHSLFVAFKSRIARS